MTTTDLLDTEHLDVDWTSPDAGLWVASTGGDYAGMIEFTEGHFVVSDATGRVIATTPSIPAAKLALSSGPAPRVERAPFGPLSALSHLSRPGYRRGNGRVA